MISIRRVSVAFQRPRPHWIPTQLSSRRLYQTIKAKAKAKEDIEDDDDVATPKAFIHATETPLAEELDSLGVYRKSTAWYSALRRRYVAAEKKAGRKPETKAPEPEPEVADAEGIEGTRSKRSSTALTLLRKLAAAKKPPTRVEIWKTIIDTERKYQAKLKKFTRTQALLLQANDDRPPRAAEIVYEAFVKTENGEFTETERLKVEDELISITPPVSKRPVKRHSPHDNPPPPWARTPLVGDRSRIHVVDEKLCDDVLRNTPLLERHKGCDIIDMYPGAGLFSRKLNDILQPRSHILLEPEAKVYKSFLEPLLERPGSKLVPKSGIVWKELNSVLTPEFLPHQKVVERVPGKSPQRNDTLLVVANLGFHPSKPYMGFKSMVTMVLYQFITSIRLRGLFQKYGLVRMLIWVRPPELDNILPQLLHNRRRGAAEAELVSEYIAEVCTSEERQSHRAGINRHTTIELQSARNALDRMRKLGLEMPEGREMSEYMKYVLEVEAAGQELPVVGTSAARSRKSMSHEGTGKFEQGMTSWMLSRSWYWQELLELANEAESIWFSLQEKRELAKGDPNPEVAKEIKTMQEQIDKIARDWNAKFEHYSYGKFKVNKYVDEARTFTMDPPLLLWDRRPVEPFRVTPTEFFPNIPLSFVDIQPKPVNPLLLEYGKDSSRHGDHFEALLTALFRQRNARVTKLMAELAHGAVGGLGLEKLESYNDPRIGGSVIKGHDSLRPIVMGEQQIIDLLVAWMTWPFRPSYEELATRNRDDTAEDPLEFIG